MENMSLHQVRESIIQLENALITNTPAIAGLLREIWKQLKSEPETVTLLEEHEIARLIAGLEKQTNVAIVANAPKSSSKSLKSITVDDL